MKKLDWLVFALVAALSLLPLVFLLQGRQKTTVEICVHGAVLYSGSIDSDKRIVTPDGHNVILIEGGVARMQEADCPDGACLRQGTATALRPIVCLPNGVVVRLVGEEAGYDAIAS